MKTITLLFLLAAAAFGQSRITLSGAAVPTGGNAVMDIAMVGGGMNAASIQFSIALPPGATIRPGPAIPAEKTLYTNTVGGTTIFILAGAKSIIPDGVIASVVFPSSFFTFAPTGAIAVDSSTNTVAFTAPASFVYGFSPCDLNTDGVVNSLDIRNVVDQADKVMACTNGDLNGDGSCDVHDVQRVINAAMGDVCKVGK